LSFTVAVKLEVPVAVGVPEMVPVVAARVSPAGRLPELIDHVYDGLPPAAVIGAEYATPSVPVGNVPVVIVSGAEAMTNEIVADLVCTGLEESVTVAVTFTVMAAVGVPEIVPVPVASVSPAGRFPDVMDQLYGVAPPVAVSVAL
jgi:hypothetical protein